MKSVEKTLSRWPILALALLVGTGAGVFVCGLGSLNAVRFGKCAVQSDLLRYQIGSERKHGPVAVLADLEALRAQFQKSFLQATPDDIVTADLFRGRADDGEGCASVFKVGDGRNVHFSVLVSKGHSDWLVSRGENIGLAGVEFPFDAFDYPIADAGNVLAFERRDNEVPIVFTLRFVASSSPMRSRFWFGSKSFDFFSVRASILNGFDHNGLFAELHVVQHTATAHFDVEPGRRVNGGLSKKGGERYVDLSVLVSKGHSVTNYEMVEDANEEPRLSKLMANGSSVPRPKVTFFQLRSTPSVLCKVIAQDHEIQCTSTAHFSAWPGSQNPPNKEVQA